MTTETLEKPNHAIQNARGWLEEISRLVVALDDDGLTDDQREAARDEINEGPLSIRVRDGWRNAGVERDADSPEEYEILLSTGGPALRIYGELGGYSTPDDDPRLQWQDWGVPWTDYPLDSEQRGHVATYARQFYFGD